MSRSPERLMADSLEAFIGADSPENTNSAWERLSLMVRNTDDVRFIAEAARATHKALAKQVEEMRQLVAAIEGGPNPLLPVVMSLGENSYVVSHGRGQYSRVAAMLDQETGEPLLSPEEFDSRGPCIGALDPNGSLVVTAYWYDENPDLFLMLLGQDEGRVDTVEDDYDGWAAGREGLRQPQEVGIED